ncbi:MAG: hypothetical protein ACFCU5_14260 [Pleurocapsa sp.]
MTEQKQVLIVSPSVKVNAPKMFSASQLTKIMVSHVERLNYINFRQWLLLILLNLLSFSFIALAYLCCADS